MGDENFSGQTPKFFRNKATFTLIRHLIPFKKILHRLWLFEFLGIKNPNLNTSVLAAMVIS